MTTLIYTPVQSRPDRYQWSGHDFDLASEKGIFDGRRVELMSGEILEMAPMNDPHAQSVRLANYALLPHFPPSKFTIGIQCPMRLGEFRPLPDMFVVPGTPGEVVHHPTTALLVIEVSDTTLEYDRTEKAALYAAHDISDYWIINVNERCVEVHRVPVKDASGQFAYQELRRFSAEQQISPLASPTALIKVQELLP